MSQIKIEAVMKAAVSQGCLGEDQALAAFVDTDKLSQTIVSLGQAFPSHFEHAFAAKANSMRQALNFVRQAGMSCEVASVGELEQALRAGFEPQKIVYDEPAKTESVLRKVLLRGIGLNIDNFQELDRVNSLLMECESSSRIGIRINPQVGVGRIGPMSTASLTSKFGVALEDDSNREKLVSSCRDRAWLTSLHCHVGSQGCALELMATGVRKVVDLALEINAAVGFQQVQLIDIGGGLPVNFDGDEVTPGFAHYAEILRGRVPELFTGHFQVKTEFGRSIFAKNGFIAARVEYTKSSGGRSIAISHAGVQVAARTVFMPDYWKIRISVFDPTGKQKHGDESVQDIAGPCCFAGDMIATERLLPRIEPGDYVVLHDTGAYYFSMPFYYNALPAPAVYGAESGAGKAVSFTPWRKQQTMDDLLAVVG